VLADRGTPGQLTGLGPGERLGVAAVALLTVVAGALHYASGVSAVAAFIPATLALAGQAWLVALAAEQVGLRYGHAITGVLHSTVGNLPEFFVVIFALQAGDVVVAQTAILGSILVNALLVLGIVLVCGALTTKDSVMRFSPRLPNDTATLLLVSSFIIVLVGVAISSHDPASRHTEAVSVVAALAVLTVYAVWLRQYLVSESDRSSEHEQPRLSASAGLALLLGAGFASAFVSDWFVSALEPTIQKLGISQAFAGLVIVAIAGNAVENVAGVSMALKGRADLAISIVKNSVAQLAAFLFPLLVLVSLFTATSLTFALPPVLIAALFGTSVLVWQITGDGEATPFEGAALIAAYLTIAVIAVFK
jgi:Ca2+:H+ antiporter